MKLTAIMFGFTGTNSIQTENLSIYCGKVLDQRVVMGVDHQTIGFSQQHPKHPLNSLLTV